MNLVFAGRDPFFLPSIKHAEARSGATVAGVLSRREEDHAVAAWLNEHEVPTADLEILRNPEEAGRVLSGWEPDYLINFNATIIYPEALLRIPARGALNMHPGLLPEYAGLHTHQWAIRHGESEFGATLHWMEPRVDGGDILFRGTYPLTENDNGYTAFIKCLRVGQRLVKRAVDLMAEGENLPRVPQDLSARRLYTDRQAQDGTIDWRLPPDPLLRFFRAADYGMFESPTYQPTTYLDGRTVVLRAARSGGSANPDREPGTVVRADQDELEVVCGDQRTLVCAIERSQGAPPRVGDRFAAG